MSDSVVILKSDDIDEHGIGCECGDCNNNGKSYGVGIYIVPTLSAKDYQNIVGCVLFGDMEEEPKSSLVNNIISLFDSYKKEFKNIHMKCVNTDNDLCGVVYSKENIDYESAETYLKLYASYDEFSSSIDDVDTRCYSYSEEEAFSSAEKYCKENQYIIFETK